MEAKKRSHHRKPRPADLVAKGKQIHKYKMQPITPEFCKRYTKDFCFNNPEIHNAALDTVREMRLTGKQNKFIIPYIHSNFNLKMEHCVEICKEATAIMKEEATMETEDVREKALNVLWGIIYDNKSLEPKVALQAIQLVCKIVKIFNDTPLIQNNELTFQLENYDIKELDKLMTQIKDIPIIEPTKGVSNSKLEEDLQKLKDLEPYIMENASKFEATKLDSLDDE